MAKLLNHAIVFFALCIMVIAGISCDKPPSFKCEIQSVSNQFTNVKESLYDSISEYEVGLMFGSGQTAQTIPVVIDTGSSDLVVNGNASICPSCSGIRYTPNPPAKVVSNNNLCLSYGSASGYAHTYSDLVGLNCGGQVSTEFAVVVSGPSAGCSSGGSQDTPIPNVFGLAGKELSKVNPNGPTFLDTYIQQNKLLNQFTIMLCEEADASRFALGTPLDGLDTTKMQFVNFVNQGFYWVLAKSIGVKGGKTLGNFTPSVGPVQSNTQQTTQGAPVIVDSGTTLSKIDPVVASAVIQYLKQVASTIPDASFPAEFWGGTDASNANFAVSIPVGVLAKFPVLQITFYNSYNGKDVVVDIRPDSYFKDVGGGKRTNGIRPSDPGDPGSILGQSFLGSVVALFDREIGNLGLMSNATACTQNANTSSNNSNSNNNSNSVTPNNPSKPVDPTQTKAANIDCTSFVPQSKSAQNAINAKFATSTQALTFCQNTIATACTQNEASNLVSGSVTALPTLCRLQYAQYVEALASGGGSNLGQACKKLLYHSLDTSNFQTLSNRFKPAKLNGFIEETALSTACGSLNCNAIDLNSLITDPNYDTSNSECKKEYTNFVNDVNTCVEAPSCFIDVKNPAIPAEGCPSGIKPCTTPSNPTSSPYLYCCVQ